VVHRLVERPGLSRNRSLTAGLLGGETWDDATEGIVKIGARVQNRSGEHHVTVTTNGITQSLVIPPKASGVGSSANGGELLFLALATCYCNDLYREAATRGIRVEQVEVEVEGQFGAAGEPATGVTYRAKVTAHAAEAEIRDLMQQTDTLAEIQNTLRVPTPVLLDQIEAVVVRP
jgi:organic hydroperoxide reductase OsmC/OhrA